ncbi:FMN-dependent NADH-azoreductase [Agrobacterium pusense]|uniref:FMN-dependent NADH-azoreductase n=1 Tax=Agrobacterium pusense TaxID=648995 RepID=UPI0008922022|nr:NAD(P)H-dependent oxidoreductase [Agrobacterium pusense]OOO22970.1 FMN-dependent NADH-azoreductase [Agrobacterium pusense]WKD48059.1 NAD(P)H-dependent oxidoreductase [Agrobacterium pusense]SDF59041.1 FMN-dependent NADH-azoreductase [Agrobacterium pusense]
MPKLLVIESSPRGTHSISRGLTAAFVEQWLENNPEGTVVNRDLMETNLPFVTMPWLGAYFTPPERHTVEMKDILRLSDELVDEILSADHIAIGTPVYNYNIPAVLKAYVDHIVRKGKTLGFGGEGLVKGKACTILMASGGVYTEGSPIRDRDLATTYLKLILKVIGIEDVTVVAGGNAKAIDMGEVSRGDFLGEFTSQIAQAAARA